MVGREQWSLVHAAIWPLLMYVGVESCSSNSPCLLVRCNRQLFGVFRVEREALPSCKGRDE